MAELTSNPSPDVFGTKVGFNSCKLESAQGSTGVSPLCPQCSSKKSGETVFEVYQLGKRPSVGSAEIAGYDSLIGKASKIEQNQLQLLKQLNRRD
jgi:hypothetical protein